MGYILIANKTPYRQSPPAPPHETPCEAFPTLAVGLITMGVVHGNGFWASAHEGVFAAAAGGRVNHGTGGHVDHGRRVQLCCV
jgi:hypothetical protein